MAKLGRPSKGKAKMVFTAFQIPPKHKEYLEYIAGYGEKSYAELLREAVKEYLIKRKFI
jgi:predicted DNA-binding protein